jgi:chromosome segregation ATPase
MTDVDAQEEDLDEEHKEKEAWDNQFLALKKSIVILQQTTVVHKDKIISLKKAVAVLQDNTASLKKGILEVWVEKMKPTFGEVAEKANHLARSSSTPTPSPSTSSFRLSVCRTHKQAHYNE